MRSLADHLSAPSLADPPSGSDVVDGCAGGSCGVVARFFLTTDNVGTITSCTARVRGRASAFATASALSEAAQGRSIVDAARLGLATLHDSFVALDDDDRERAAVVEDAFHHALGQWLLRHMRQGGAGTGAARPRLPAAITDPAIGAVVGMSGGVDSAVALHRVARELAGAPGSVAVGATLRLWIDPRAPDPEAACCSPDSVRRARATCHSAGFPHLSIDLRSAFARDVVAPFIEQYRAGETPNPCVGCNGGFRLDELVRLADVIGAGRIATGHYVRTARRGGVALVQRGVDERKDQSYMLATLDPATIDRLWFPLGGSVKPDIRREAAAFGLVQATAPESQEVCFLGGGDYRDFLGRVDALGPTGNIVMRDRPGSPPVVLGSHDGMARFTPGQRRGIGVSRPPGSGDDANPEPLYVLDVEPSSGTVTVGDITSLGRSEVVVRGFRSHGTIDDTARLTAQVRYRARQGGAAATVTVHGGGAATVRFATPVRAPAPGQTLVLYDTDQVVVGAGTIVRP